MSRDRTRVARGVHREANSNRPFSATVAAWATALPSTAHLSHVTGALALGLWVPWLPESIADARRIWVQLPADAAPLRRPEVTALRAGFTGAPVDVGLSLPVAPVGDVLLSLAGSLDEADLLVAVDSALHTGLVDVAALVEIAARRRRGAPALRRVLARADRRSESAWETVLREFHRVMEVEVEPQFEVRDSAGTFVARGDLRLAGHRVLHEYDGSHHQEVERQRHDLRRARRLEAAGWIRRGYSSDDLVQRPHEMAEDLDRTLGRAGDARRLSEWRRWVGASAVSASGRRALWRRLGV